MTARPDFITEEQIAKWDTDLKNDTTLLETIPLELINEPEMKEVLYAGLWVVEELTRMGYDSTTVSDIQYSHGRQSFGRDTWQIAKIFVDAYKFSAPNRKKN